MGCHVRNGVGAASDGALAGLAGPDTGGVSLDSGLAAEGADVLGVLGDFHLLDLLTQRGTVTVQGDKVSRRVPCVVCDSFRFQAS
jgi:hypothetical protein